MNANLVLVIAGQASLYLIFLVAFCIFRKRMRGAEQRRLAELQQALIHHEQEVDHRIDAATREADEGCKTCSRCGFGNFQRFSSCAICHALLDQRGARDVKCIDPVSFQDGAMRRRSEWQRKFDIQGRLFWYRNDSIVTEKSFSLRDVAIPAVVYAWKMEQQGSNLERRDECNGYEPCPSDSERPTSVCSEDVDPSDTQAKAIRPVAESLRMEAELMEYNLTPSKEADASVMPNGEVIESDERRKELVQFSQMVFPVKYANFVVSTASMMAPPEVRFLKLSVHRQFAVEESLDHLACIRERNIRSVMRINFLDEKVVDAGGVHREWFMLVNESIVNDLLGVFKCTNPSMNTYYLNPNSFEVLGEGHLVSIYGAGRLIGRALLEGQTLSFHLCEPLLKIIVGMPVGFEDLELYDPVLYKSLTWIVQNNGVENLNLDFTVPACAGAEHCYIELIPDGNSINVNDENKEMYLQRRFRYELFESVHHQLYAFLRGIYDVVPPILLTQFDHMELDFLLCGSDEIDASSWKENTVVSSNLTGTDLIRWFWEIIDDMSNEHRCRLLQFVTGCSRLPIMGFKGLTSYDGRLCPFTLRGTTLATSQYIRSHACFNRLDLPFYTSKAELERNLFATLETELYGFTTE